MDEQSALEQQEQNNTVITIVLTADNHLGYTVPGQHPRKREELRQRQRHAFQQAADFAIGQAVDLFIQAGDLFDTPHPDEQDRSFVATRLAQLKQAGIRVFALGGVHDTPAETYSRLGEAATPVLSPQLSYASLGALHYFAPNQPVGTPLVGVLDDSGSHANGHPTGGHPPGVSLLTPQHVLQPVMLDVRGTLVGICGLGVVSGQQGDPLAQARIDNDIERAAIPLLLLHAPIEGVTSGTTALDTQAQVSRASIAEQSAFRYILSGYHHVFTRLSIGQSEVIVAGSTQHTGRDAIYRVRGNDNRFPDANRDRADDNREHTDEPGFVFLGIAADGVRWCRHITVDAVQMRRLVISVAELWPEDTRAEEAQAIASDETPTETPTKTPTGRILDQLRPLCSADVMVQLRLEGELTHQQYHQLDLNQLRLYGEEHTFALTIDDSALVFLPDTPGNGGHLTLSRVQSTSFATSEIEERLSPRDELIRLADEWIAAAEDEQEQQALVATKEELLAAFWKL